MSWDGYLNDKLKTRHYQYRMDAKKDILNTIRAYGDLHPEESLYFNEETNKQFNILCLTGTIPVSYKGSSYNIPILIQLLHSHPHQAPLVFVKPTSTMVIKPSRHVDEKGRVYLPMLTEWQQQNMGNKGGMIDLIKQLQIIFGQTPPVYAKSAQQPQTQQQQIPPHRPTFPTPYPAGGQSGGHVPHGGMPMPQPSMYPSSQRSQFPQGYGVSGSTPYPSGNTPYPSGNTPYPSGNTPYPSGGSNPPPYPAATSMNSGPVSNQSPYPSTSSQLQQNHLQQQQQQQTNNVQRQDSAIDEQMVRMSLLSTAEDKLKQRIQEVFEMARIEQENLQMTKVKLESGGTKLTSMMHEMREEKANLEANISLLEQKNSEIDDLLEKMESDSANMNIDETIVTTNPIHAQILDLYAEESAIEDTLYYLTEGLRREVVPLTEFLKSVRKLSRKQFMLRATLIKAREVAGLR